LRPTFAALQSCEVIAHLRGRRVALARIIRASFYQHVVQPEKRFLVRTRAQARIDFWKIEPIFSRTDFVE
jgi:hypothetical protein